MGIESYSFIIVSNKVDFKIEDSFWRLKGSSDIKSEEINRLLNSICKKKKESFIYNEIIDVFVIEKNNIFQGIEIKGCLSYFEKGIEMCFDLYQKINNCIPVYIVISNRQEQLKERKDFLECMYSEYKEKLEFFQKQYGERELYLSIRQFYKYIKIKKYLGESKIVYRLYKICSKGLS